MRTAKIRTILRISLVRSESSHDTLWVAKGPKCLQADSEDEDAQAHLSHHWAHMQFCGKCCAPAQMSPCYLSSDERNAPITVMLAHAVLSGNAYRANTCTASGLVEATVLL